MNDLTLLAENFVSLFLDSAPWLLLGLLVAGIMHELVPIALLQKQLGDNSIKAVLKAAFIGAPLPLCSCGVIPAALGLRRSGASKPATVSFLVATPETGVDSVSVSYALLGPLFAVVRPIAAIFSAIYTGLLVKWFADEEKQTNQTEATQKACCSTKKATAPANTESDKTSSCCALKQTAEVRPKTDSDCCSSGNVNPPAKRSTLRAIGDIFAYSSGKLLEDITLWLLIGLALAAAIQTWVPVDFLTQWGDGLFAMLLMAVIGIPMYICATASTPVALGFLGAGLSPGAVLVFMLAGPATNISTMGMIGKEMGKRTLILYLTGVISISIGLGYLLNVLIDTFAWQSYISGSQAAHQHSEFEIIYVLCAMLLAGLIIRNLWQAYNKKRQRDSQASHSCCH